MLVEIELISEAIFGNGEATTSFVDMEILKDENRLPYFKGKTFKVDFEIKFLETTDVVSSNILNF